MKIIKNPDLDLQKEFEEHFKVSKFCPCMVEDVICMCPEFKNQDFGECHCGRFIKE